MSLLLLFNDNTLTPTVPQVITVTETNLTQTTATFNGEIVGYGGAVPNVRGFQYNTVPFPDKELTEYSDSWDSLVESWDSMTMLWDDTDFTGGPFSLPVTDLIPGTLYYFRAFAVNSQGVGYGDWFSFTTLPAIYNITINGVDRTYDIINQSIIVEDVLNDQQNTLNFVMVDRSEIGFPSTNQEITITLNDGTLLFGGYIQSIKLSSVKQSGRVQASISCIDYVSLFDRNLVNKTYENMTDAAIIADIVNTYCPGFGITTTNVIAGVTIDQIAFNYLQPSQCLRRICELTGRSWYIDYSKDIHYFPLATNLAPFNISATNDEYMDLGISKDASQLKNRVYVRGGTKLSDPTFYETKGDGIARKFPLPDKPHDVTVKVNGATKTLGIKNINLSGFDYYLNFQEKYIEQDASLTLLSTTDTLRLDYSYDIPILVAVEDTASILANGQKEFAIFDKSIKTTQAARDRASAELTDYANNLIEGTFRTYTPAFRAGQYLNINLSAYGINENYLVQKVSARAFGAGNYVYDVSIASAKTMGIILFLIELLEANKNLVELDNNEVVDELLEITDSLLADSLLDSLIIDSAGPYATWCSDSLQSSPSTRAIWDLFQWG